MAKNPYFGDPAGMAHRVGHFTKLLPEMTDEGLFEAFHAIEIAKKSAKPGNGEGEQEELFLKELAAEAEIIKRNPVKMMRAYHDWVKLRNEG